MLIKFFVEAAEKELAISIVNKGLYDAQEYVKEEEIKNVIPYWKEKDMYIVELALELYQGVLHNFLQVFSDAWLELGYPVDELLASRNNKDCAYMKEGIVLINVFISA